MLGFGASIAPWFLGGGTKIGESFLPAARDLSPGALQNVYNMPGYTGGYTWGG